MTRGHENAFTPSGLLRDFHDRGERMAPAPSEGRVARRDTHDCPYLDALLDILDIREGWIAPQIQAKSAEEKLALIYSHVEKVVMADA